MNILTDKNGKMRVKLTKTEANHIAKAAPILKRIAVNVLDDDDLAARLEEGSEACKEAVFLFGPEKDEDDGAKPTPPRAASADKDDS